MNKEYLWLLPIIILPLAVAFMPKKEFKKVCINDACFKVEIADTPEKRSKGLMERQSLAEDKGMLFIFEQEGIHNFWTKNTLIPLDIIWADKDKEIIYIQKQAQPCYEEKCQSLGPDKESKYVLEINAGLTDELNIDTGDKLLITFKDNWCKIYISKAL